MRAAQAAGDEGATIVLASDAEVKRLNADHRGKNKPTFTPHLDTGDFVVVINADKVRVSGNKATQKIYRRHSGSVLERKDDAYGEHWQIIRAIRARDAELAESLMRSHIERAAQHLFTHLPQLAPLTAGDRAI